MDARQRKIFFLLRLDISDNPIQELPIELGIEMLPSKPKSVIIVGAGPAGYFAALQLIKLGLKPIVLDRGKDVQQRRRDLRAIQQESIVNPHSNYCFGEGGAGTYSDGKLYTRAHKRGNIKHILETFVAHGAKSNILIDAHPHIGSNKLPNIVTAIRQTIEKFGGIVSFDSHVVDLILVDGKIKGAITADEEKYMAEALILATGHSARDIYKLLHEKQIRMEAKDFALGVRIEHPQSIIDYAQYKQKSRHKNLPAASYKLACQIEGNGVLFFLYVSWWAHCSCSYGTRGDCREWDEFV